MVPNFCELRIKDPDKTRGHTYEGTGERGNLEGELPFNLKSVPLKLFRHES
jgi:hypothetical protein